MGSEMCIRDSYSVVQSEMDLKYALGQKIDIPRTVLISANAAQWDVNLRNTRDGPAILACINRLLFKYLNTFTIYSSHIWRYDLLTC